MDSIFYSLYVYTMLKLSTTRSLFLLHANELMFKLRFA